jgi:hypothetical protein
MGGRCIRSRKPIEMSGRRSARILEMTFRLSKESPPSSKKLSVSPPRLDAEYLLADILGRLALADDTVSNSVKSRPIGKKTCNHALLPSFV